MLRLQYETARYAFEYPFETSHGLRTHQDALLVKVGFGPWTGHGECTSIPYYQADVAAYYQLLTEYKKAVEQYAYNGPERFWHFLHHLFPGKNFLIAALDIAGWDLFARMKQTSLHSIIGLQWKHLKPTCYTIGIQDIPTLEQIVSAKRSPVYKLKVNGLDDLEHVRALRKHTTADIWIDANGAWKADDARAILGELAQLGIKLIEQPFAPGEDEQVAACKSLAPGIIFIADESCKTAADLDLALQHYDGVNIKLSKCGGMTPALQMMQRLKKEGKNIMIGNMCESQAGANALAHLIPIADYVDIDGPLLLQTNPSLVYEEGYISIPDPYGSGYRP